jgi:hypothetical protein
MEAVVLRLAQVLRGLLRAHKGMKEPSYGTSPYYLRVGGAGVIFKASKPGAGGPECDQGTFVREWLFID